MTGSEAERVEQLVLEINVSDLDRSLTIYTALGFTLDRRDGGFAALRWGDRRLFLSESSDLPPNIGASRGNVRIVVPDVDRMWSLALELNLPVEQEIADRYYGLRDFSALDPDGFGLRFASVLPLDRASAKQDAFRVQGLDHVAMTVRDVARSVTWYQSVLGLERRYESVWGDFPAVVGIGTTSVALFPAPVTEPGRQPASPEVSIRHVAFRVDRQTFERAGAALDAHGLAPRFEDHVASHSLYFTDLDGHQLEITTYDP
ncbi:MAG: VOC family protein [Gemmatimonadaceae bacterium]